MAFDSVMELKLCLLHHCLTVEGAKGMLLSLQHEELLKEVHEEKTLRVHIEELVKIGDHLSREFIAKLTDIRKYTLGS